MNFRPEMVLAIRRGKCETRRVVSDNPRSPWYGGGCALHVPGPGFERFRKSYAICPGRGKAGVARLELLREPERHLLENVTETGAIYEGFESREKFLAYVLDLNPGLSVKDEVWAIRFKVVLWDESAFGRFLADLPEDFIEKAEAKGIRV